MQARVVVALEAAYSSVRGQMRLSPRQSAIEPMTKNGSC